MTEILFKKGVKSQEIYSSIEHSENTHKVWQIIFPSLNQFPVILIDKSVMK